MRVQIRNTVSHMLSPWRLLRVTHRMPIRLSITTKTDAIMATPTTVLPPYRNYLYPIITCARRFVNIIPHISPYSI